MKKVLANLQEACHWVGAGIGQYEQHLMRALFDLHQFDLHGVYHRTNLEGAPFPFPARYCRWPSWYFMNLKSPLRHVPVSYQSWVGCRDADVSLFMGNFIPAVPLKGKVVCVVHDLILIRVPEEIIRMGWAGPGIVEETRRVLQRVRERADVICTDSEFSRGEIASELNVDPAKIPIVMPGVEYDEYASPCERDAFVKVKYRLPEDYLLYFGGMTGYKNVATLIRGYARLESDLRRRYPLVISGRKDDLITLAMELGVASDVHFIGFVEESDKPSVYRNARAFAFLSLIEGFGMTPLEAMAAGLPTVTSNRASLPEVGDGATLLCEPDDLDDVAAQLRKALCDEALRATLREKGQAVARRRSWNASARQMAQVLEAC